MLGAYVVYKPCTGCSLKGIFKLINNIAATKSPILSPPQFWSISQTPTASRSHLYIFPTYPSAMISAIMDNYGRWTGLMHVFLSSSLIGSVTHFPSSLISVGYHVTIVIGRHFSFSQKRSLWRMVSIFQT